ncbi:hypothetical protein Chor_004716 [Crotalus horridus]
MKTFLSVICVFVIAQLVGTVLYILHLHIKLDKMGNELTLHEDYVFLKRVQNCRKPQGDDVSFLDCVKISETFRELMDFPQKSTIYAPKDEAFSNSDGKITIRKEGRYYIYAQVTFCSKPDLRAPFNVLVYLNLPLETDQLLLKGVGTYSSSVDMCGLQSIYVGRAVELQSGCTVFVNVTDISRVNYAHGNTYFGLIQLS